MQDAMNATVPSRAPALDRVVSRPDRGIRTLAIRRYARPSPATHQEFGFIDISVTLRCEGRSYTGGELRWNPGVSIAVGLVMIALSFLVPGATRDLIFRVLGVMAIVAGSVMWVTRR